MKDSKFKYGDVFYYTVKDHPTFLVKAVVIGYSWTESLSWVKYLVLEHRGIYYHNKGTWVQHMRIGSEMYKRAIKCGEMEEHEIVLEMLQ
jgi:hypothetical protein